MGGYPYVDFNGLHCGFDHSTDLSVVEVGHSYSIVCNSHSKSGNHVCGLNTIMTIIEDFYKKNSVSKEEVVGIIETVCSQLSTSTIRVSYNLEKQVLNVVEI